MPSLSDKLKSMGIKVGPGSLQPPVSRARFGIDQVVSGRNLSNSMGEAFVAEARYPALYQHGAICLRCSAPLQTLGRWAEAERVGTLPLESFAFLDTETTGLSGGSGTYAFLVGIGRFVGDEFSVAQFFMRDPTEEPALLYAIEEFLAPCQALVTFNGKAFDIPLLNTRYIHHGWQKPYGNFDHLDLLHLARRLWRDRLPSRTLGYLEVHILGAARTLEDVPGWMIPQIYFDYLRSGDARPLRSVFYHNQMDVVSLAALFSHSAGVLAEPFSGIVQHAEDYAALGRLFEDLDDQDQAIQLYQYALHQSLSPGAWNDVAYRLSMIHKRRAELEIAVNLWEQAAQSDLIEAYVELAKYYEHRARDYPRALDWTQAAMARLNSSLFTSLERRAWLGDLEHRLQRLQRKLAHPDTAETEPDE